MHWNFFLPFLKITAASDLPTVLYQLQSYKSSDELFTFLYKDIFAVNLLNQKWTWEYHDWSQDNENTHSDQHGDQLSCEPRTVGIPGMRDLQPWKQEKVSGRQHEEQHVEAAIY